MRKPYALFVLPLVVAAGLPACDAVLGIKAHDLAVGDGSSPIEFSGNPDASPTTDDGGFDAAPATVDGGTDGTLSSDASPDGQATPDAAPDASVVTGGGDGATDAAPAIDASQDALPAVDAASDAPVLTDGGGDGSLDASLVGDASQDAPAVTDAARDTGIPLARPLGCYEDFMDGGARVLTGAITSSAAMTYQACADFCSGYTYYGVEDGNQCFCGNSLVSPVLAPNATDCNMACSGSSTEICGASDRINIYSPLLGCYEDFMDGGARVLTGAITSSATMTYLACADFCLGYTYYGVEDGNQCFCGNSLVNPVVAPNATDCNMACSGSATEICGASDRIDIYSPLLGCYEDFMDGGARVLTGTSTSSAAMTYLACAEFCSGYTYYGVEDGNQCFCGDSLVNPVVAPGATDCNMACSGSATEICGAADRIDIYSAP